MCCKGKGAPSLFQADKTLVSWEEIARRNLDVMSVLDFFLLGFIRVFQRPEDMHQDDQSSVKNSEEVLDSEALSTFLCSSLMELSMPSPLLAASTSTPF